ncbi:hypothetical protein GGR50DRAFT_370837 [Xylaria sp. CBS 124048]|nr:hypothetical protein GGR50DRAFT_370837 [Xylaria sp. CBS 124048]
MADQRRLLESAIGLAGRLWHIPYGTDKPENCGWQSSRNFVQNAPVFRALGPYRTWLPPEPEHVADLLRLPPRLSWKQRRKQKRWLVKSHPEASLGNPMVHDLLDEDASLPPQQERSWHSCFFSLGELTDTSMERTTGIPLAVTVTGSARNVLRLARLEQEQWTWHRVPNVAVRLSGAAVEKPALWLGDDVGPIHRVKCLVNLRPYSPTRWLAVQRDSGTTIFQPEYRKAPPVGSLEEDASCIAANPLFHLSREQTGGNTHADVSFNPGTRSKSPQLAIIDERGFWTVWDVRFTRLGLAHERVLRMRLCGHINHGVLEQLPDRDNSDTKWHKVLWVGSSEDSDILGSFELDDVTEDLGSQTTFSSALRSSSLLVYNSQRVRLFNLTTAGYLPDLVFRRPDSLDHILDVQTTHNPQYFCVLTTSKLYFVRTYFKPGAELDKPLKMWTILFSTPHFRSCFDLSLKLSVTQGFSPDRTGWLVFLYAPTNPWTEAFYFELSSTDPNKVRCQPNVTALGGIQDTILNSAIRNLHVNPIPIVAKAPERLSITGHNLVNKRIKLYQVVALRSDMSLVAGLCAFLLSSSMEIGAPDQKVSRRAKAERWRGSRPRHLLSRFVIDDDSATSDEEPPSAASQRYVKVFYEHLNSIFSECNKDHSARSPQSGFSEHNPFDAVQLNVDESLAADRPIPTRTLLQIMPSFKEASRKSFSAVEWEDEIGKLNSIHPSVAVYSFDLLRSSLDLPLSASSQEAYNKQLEIINTSLHHRGGKNENENEQHVMAASEQISYDLSLSLYGIGRRDPIEHNSQAAEDDTLAESQAETLPSSPPRLESPASATTLSQRSTPEVAEGEDPAMTLLKAYTGTGRFVPEKRFELLDKWQLGAHPSDYVFDLDRSDDAEARKLRRAKQLARENRKRRRAASLLHLSQEPELPASQPAPTTSFSESQPRGISSQRQNLLHSDIQLMSHPPDGVFGKRPKAKKRKGGF